MNPYEAALASEDYPELDDILALRPPLEASVPTNVSSGTGMTSLSKKAELVSGRPFLHGTNQVLTAGTVLTPRGSGANFEDNGVREHHVYVTQSPSSAEDYAGMAVNKHGGAPHVYEVEPLDGPRDDEETASQGGYSDGTCSSARVIREIDPSSLYSIDGPAGWKTASYIIEYTNPTHLVKEVGAPWQCAVCKNKYDSEEEARSCAERDHARKRRAATLQVEASWADVQQKAHDIFKIDGVRIIANDQDHVAAHVLGDHGTYESEIQYVPGTKTPAMWNCSCPWSAYSWGRSGRWKKYEGRVCSHVLALMYERQHDPSVEEKADWDTDPLTFYEAPPPKEWRAAALAEELAFEADLDEARDRDGEWTDDGNVIHEHEARGNSRGVSLDEFNKLKAEGKDRLDALIQNKRPAVAFEDPGEWSQVQRRAHDEVQKDWGGQTIDPRTGEAVHPETGYALAIRHPDEKQLSVPVGASKEALSAEMDKAKATYADRLGADGVFLGVFRDDDEKRIDIDPVAIVDTPHEVETIGAHCHSIGGAYDFSSEVNGESGTGTGYFPPHVKGSKTAAISVTDPSFDIEQTLQQLRDANPDMPDAQIEQFRSLIKNQQERESTPVSHEYLPEDKPATLYHETDADLKPGDIVDSAAARGYDSPWAQGVTTYDPNKVYMTTNPDYDIPYGKNTYEVEPVGELHRDPLYYDLSPEARSQWDSDGTRFYWVAPKARVVRKVSLKKTAGQAETISTILQSPEGRKVLADAFDSPYNGWTHGGCRLAAEAIQPLFPGSKIKAIVADRTGTTGRWSHDDVEREWSPDPDSGQHMVQHYVVETAPGVYVDGNGEHGDEILTDDEYGGFRFKDGRPANILIDATPGLIEDNRGIHSTPELAAKVTDFIRNHKDYLVPVTAKVALYEDNVWNHHENVLGDNPAEGALDTENVRSFNDRPVPDAGSGVAVYRDLSGAPKSGFEPHTSFSVKGMSPTGGRTPTVQAHVRTITLKNPRPVFDEAARQKAIDTGKRGVHAYIGGTVDHYNPLPSSPDGWRPVSYFPDLGHFFMGDTRETFEGADEAHLNGGSMLVRGNIKTGPVVGPSIFEQPHEKAASLWVEAEAEDMILIEADFDPNEKRDESGEWTTSPGSVRIEPLEGDTVKAGHVAVDLRMHEVPKPVRKAVMDRFKGSVGVDPKVALHNVVTQFERTPDDVKTEYLQWYSKTHNLSRTLGTANSVNPHIVAAIIAASSAGASWSSKGGNKDVAQVIVEEAAPATRTQPIPENVRKWVNERLVAKRVKKKANSTETQELPPLTSWQIPPGGSLDDVFKAISKETPDTQHKILGMIVGKKYGFPVGYGYGNYGKAMKLALQNDPAQIDLNLNGPKIRSFFNNIEDPSNHKDVTVDIHMWRSFVNDGGDRAKMAKSYTKIKNNQSAITGNPSFKGIGVGAYPIAADILHMATGAINAKYGTNYTPSQVQAVVWGQQRKEWDLGDIRKLTSADDDYQGGADDDTEAQENGEPPMRIPVYSGVEPTEDDIDYFELPEGTTAAAKDYVTLYHGTDKANVDSIRQTGIRPSDLQRSAWTVDQGHDEPVVYLTKKAEDARGYGFGDEDAVVEVRVPKANVQKYPMSLGIWMHHGAIPPEQIVAVSAARVDQCSGSGHKSETVLADGGHRCGTCGEWVKVPTHGPKKGIVPPHSAADGDAKNHEKTGAVSLVKRVQGALTDDLRHAPWKGDPNPLTGHCYVASEALYHLMGGKAAGLHPMFIKHEGQPHWFLRHESGKIIDPTADQFAIPVPYDQARGKGFLRGEQVSKRAQVVMDRVLGKTAEKVQGDYDDGFADGEYDAVIGAPKDVRGASPLHSGLPDYIDGYNAGYDSHQKLAAKGRPCGVAGLRVNTLPGHDHRCACGETVRIPKSGKHKGRVPFHMTTAESFQAALDVSAPEVPSILAKLAKIAADAKAQGDDAPVYNLCDIDVEGTNLFCAAALPIPRSDMPQLQGPPVAGSLAASLPQDARGNVNIGPLLADYLRDAGYTVTPLEVDASSLKATQNQLNGAKVATLMGYVEDGSMQWTPLVVSQDDYIVDGHHRWAAEVGAEYVTGQVQTVSVLMVNEDIVPLLAECKAFAGAMGIPQGGLGPVQSLHTGSYMEMDQKWHDGQLGKDEWDAYRKGYVMHGDLNDLYTPQVESLYDGGFLSQDQWDKYRAGNPLAGVSAVFDPEQRSPEFQRGYTDGYNGRDWKHDPMFPYRKDPAPDSEYKQGWNAGREDYNGDAYDSTGEEQYANADQYREDHEHDATLHEAPEPALPTTDGGEDDALQGTTQDDIFGDDIEEAGGMGAQAVLGEDGDHPLPWGADPSDDQRGGDAIYGDDIDKAFGIGDETSSISASLQEPGAEDTEDGLGPFADHESLDTDAALRPAWLDPSGDSGGGGGGQFEDIAAAARQFLAVKTFNAAEQAALINEGEDRQAANLASLDLTGTHYQQLEEALAGADAIGEAVLWW